MNDNVTVRAAIVELLDCAPTDPQTTRLLLDALHLAEAHELELAHSSLVPEEKLARREADRVWLLAQISDIVATAVLIGLPIVDHGQEQPAAVLPSLDFPPC